MRRRNLALEIPLPYDLRREMQDLFSRHFPAADSSASRAPFPMLDVGEDSDHFYVECELPGIDAERIELDIDNNTLHIRGKRECAASGNGEAASNGAENSSAEFHRAVEFFVPLDVTNVSAELENGVLKIVLPKSEEAKPKEITIG